jgi:hypothetical protein
MNQAEENTRWPLPILMRIGIDAGHGYEAICAGQRDFYADFVDRAVRARNHAEGGQIVMPQAVLEQDEVARVLRASGLSAQSANVDLKGFGSVPVYEITT